jgi:hypothetical protein
MVNIWRDLKTDPPTGNEYAVIIFPCKSDCGVLYTISNPHYARGENALKAGYTHWCLLTLASNHDEWAKWQDDLPLTTDEDIQRSMAWLKNLGDDE